MRTRELKSKIESMQEELCDRIYSLNSGGCIHFAHYFSKALKNLGVPYKIYALDRNELYFSSYGNFHSVNHVVVYVEGIGYIDGHETVKDPRESYRYRRHIKLKDTDRLRFDYDWSPFYSGGYYNPILEKIVNKYISDN